jgi:membrane protease YdiL (CAAX protease family)
MGNLYKPLSNEEYDKIFRIKKKNNKLHKRAFKKAWEIRNFEINKFWQRSAYFWGFIAIIFGGYIHVVTGESKDIVQKMHLDLYVILLGCIFSVAWVLVIRGSKRWQDNWEAHIDRLEENITGPLYKTIYYSGNKFYSVSKINEILAVVVVVVWVFLLFRYFYDNCISLKKTLECFSQNGDFFLFVLLPVVAAVIGCIVLFLPKFAQTSGGEFKAERPNVFFDRTE